MLFGLLDGEGSEVENGGGEDSARFALYNGVGQVVEGAGTAGSDDGHFDGFAHSPVEGVVEAGLGAVGVHAGQEDFAGAEGHDCPRPFDRIEASGLAAAVCVDLPFAVFPRHALGVDRDDDALVAEAGRGLLDQIRVEDGGGVEADFIGPCVEHGTDVLDRAQAAADGERHEALGCGAFDHVDHGVALVARRGDVKEDEFVGPLLLVGFGLFHGVTRVDQIDEIDTFDHTSVMDVEARDDADRQHSC